MFFKMIKNNIDIIFAILGTILFFALLSNGFYQSVLKHTPLIYLDTFLVEHTTEKVVVNEQNAIPAERVLNMEGVIIQENQNSFYLDTKHLEVPKSLVPNAHIGDRLYIYTTNYPKYTDVNGKYILLSDENIKKGNKGIFDNIKKEEKPYLIKTTSPPKDITPYIVDRGVKVTVNEKLNLDEDSKEKIVSTFYYYTEYIFVIRFMLSLLLFILFIVVTMPIAFLCEVGKRELDF